MDQQTLSTTISAGVEAVRAGAQTATRFMPEPVARGVDFVASLGRARSLSTEGMSSDTADLINRQIELQKEMLQVTMFSNLERTRHETRMAPARNIRLS